MKTPRTFESDGFTKTLIPIYHDWTPVDVWKLIKANLYEQDGTMKLKPLEREPDGEPSGYTSILQANGKCYVHISDCQCDIAQGVCEHWQQIPE